MTNKSINEAIAKSQGWRKLRMLKTDDLGPIGNLREIRWVDPDHKPDQIRYLYSCPNYSCDLNEMHEIEKTMNEQDYRLFIGYLVECLKPGEFSVRATARQRAQAYLKMKGL